MKKSSKIYVAGHRGLLGSAVVRRLETAGFKNLLLRTRGELDLTDQQRTFEFLEKERPEYVFLCAARVGGIVANMQAQGSFLHENLSIQNHVMEGSRRAGIKKLLFVGSSCMYPREAPQPIREEHLLTGALEPTNEGYAIAKIAGVRMCSYYRTEFGCDFISAIPTNLFGPNDNYDLQTSHLLPALIAKIHRAKAEGAPRVTLWGSGTPRREFMMSDDCADALVFLMENYSDLAPVNVGTGTDLSVIELAKLVAEVVGAKVEFDCDRSRPDGMMRKLLDVSRLTSLGWSSQIPLREGLVRTYDAYRNSGDSLLNS